MSATVIIIAETDARDLQGVNDVLRNVRRDAASVGLHNVKATHYRASDGTITPAGMGEQTAQALLTPAVADIDPDAANVIDQLAQAVQAAQALMASLNRSGS